MRRCVRSQTDGAQQAVSRSYRTAAPLERLGAAVQFDEHLGHRLPGLVPIPEPARVLAPLPAAHLDGGLERTIAAATPTAVSPSGEGSRGQAHAGGLRVGFGGEAAGKAASPDAVSVLYVGHVGMCAAESVDRARCLAGEAGRLGRQPGRRQIRCTQRPPGEAVPALRFGGTQ